MLCPPDPPPQSAGAEPSPTEPPRVTLPPVPAIELLLTPADAARLSRLPMLAAHRAGRPKRVALLTVWHDGADKEMEKAGLSLSETQGRWTLEKLRPMDGDGWLPAAPAPVLGVADDAAALLQSLTGAPSGAALTPIAAFSGVRRDFPLRVEGETAQFTVLEGELRGVVESRPVCRLVLAGEPRAMARLATALSEQLTLGVPRASLGAEALALARNTQAPPRRLGGPEVAPGSSVAEALVSITTHLADVIHHWAPLVTTAATQEPVHQMRVALRRLRSALSIFRRAVRDDAAWLETLADELKALAGLLGVARDLDVFLSGIGAEVTQACGGDKRLAQMLATATRRREGAYAALRENLGDTAAWRRLGLKLALLPMLRPWEGAAPADRLAAPVEAFAAYALQRRLKHLLGAGESLDGVGAEPLHEIRKQAKALRYTIEFFAPLFPEKQVRRYLGRLEALQEDFGTFNDAAVATVLAASFGGGAERAFAAGAVQGFGAAAQSRAARHVARGWGKFYRATPFWD